MKIIVFTGSRAELFLQLPLWNTLSEEFNFEVKIIASFTNFETKEIIVRTIEKTKLKVVKWINLSNEKDQHSFKISRVLEDMNKFDVKDFNAGIVFADRYESFGFAISLSQRGVPLIHIEAGDLTKGGTFDDNVRHSITSLSSLFITTNNKASKYLKNFEIGKNRIKNCGIFNNNDFFHKKSANELIRLFDINKQQFDCIIVFTYHPLSNNINEQKNELKNIEIALTNLSKKYKLRIIITGVNADIGGMQVMEFLNKVSKINASITSHETLGASNYLGLMRIGINQKILIVGNSSSIVKEVPFYKCMGVLIGKRQLGRVLGNNTLYAEAKPEKIENAITKCIENYDKRQAPNNPYFVENSVFKAAKFISISLKNNMKSKLKNLYEDLDCE